MKKFKIGDVVRRINHRNISHNVDNLFVLEVGEVGIVIDNREIYNVIKVRYFNGITCANYIENLEILTEDKGTST